MSSRQHDRNLLAGMLALQMDFISRDQLIAAMQAWVFDKTRPLEDLLCQAGALDDDARTLVAALVARHLKMHDGDPQRSLAALSSSPALGEALASLADPDVAASLAHLGRARETTSEPGTTLSYRSSTPVDGLRFRVLRPHARGGLGEVSVAEDRELHREVALKEIQERYAADPNSRARFLLEAEITGGLEHPGIVPVYGLGTYADGRPYYAMRFIKGDSLQEAIRRFHRDEGSTESASGRRLEQSLEFRRLLGRFVDVCEAMEYAHSRGVLHRDLKPGNIMLGKYGETLVVDWGLAKSGGRKPAPSASGEHERSLRPQSASSVEPTVLGAAIGTPPYMSPEQAAGRVDELDATSDVYGLGATFYALLTGKPPIDGTDTGEVLRRAQAGDFPPPRSVNRAVPKPLEAVCLKAMSRLPAERYASARALADEIERWLADEPVTAWREPPAMRLRRWTRRHRTSVATAAAAAVVALAGLAVLAGLTQRHNRDLDARNVELLAANAREREATADAQRNEAFAREQSELALDSLKAVVFDLQRGLENVAGAQAVRRTLLAKALARLQKISDKYLARAEIDRATMVALAEMGDVVLRVGVGEDSPADRPAGGPPVAALPATERSALETAATLYARAHEIARQLADAGPDDATAQLDLAISHDKLGHVALRLGRPSEALVQYKQGLTIREKWAANDPADARAQRDLPFSYEKAGDATLQLGQPTEALAHYRRSLEIREKRAAENPADAQLQHDLLATSMKLGDVTRQLGDLPKSIDHYKRCLALAEKQAAAAPAETLAQQDLAASHEKMGEVTLQLGQPTDTLAHYQKSLGIRQKQAADNPADAQARRDLSLSCERLGHVTLQLGQPTEALEQFEQSLAIRLVLAGADPADARAQRDLAIAHDWLGYVRLQLGQAAKALEHCRQSLEIKRQLASVDLANGQAKRDLAISHDRLADTLLQLDQPAEALQHCKQSLQIRQELADADAQAQRELTVSCERLGQIALQLGQHAEAKEQFERSLAIRRKLAAADLTDAQAQRDLALAHENLGMAARQLGQPAEAMGHFEASVKIAQELAADPANAQAQNDLAAVLFKLGEAAREGFLFAAARGHFQRGLAVLEALAAHAGKQPFEQGVAELNERIQYCDLAEAAVLSLEFAAQRPQPTAAELLLQRLGGALRNGSAAPSPPGRAELLLLRVQALAAYAAGEAEVPQAVREKWPGDDGRREMLAQARLSADKARELAAGNANYLFDAARGYAICLTAAGKLAPADSALANELRRDALATLEEAIAAGWNDAPRANQEPDLAPLRDLPEFQALLEQLASPK